ncbi:MAG TPA: TonB-dependent receptor, partial [Gemmatimonadales bacterium]|nr:TonB-dependent receptor [Gemmatimonadales bacterium]
MRPRSFVRAGRLSILLTASATLPLAAQSRSCPAWSRRVSRTVFGREAASLPLDRVADLLALAPGVSAQARGELNVRAAGDGANTVYLDGVPVSSGRRAHQSPSLGGSYSGETGSGLALGINGFSELQLNSGSMSAELGNAVGGVFEIRTVPCATAEGSSRWITAGVASDAFLGADRGIGLNRITLNGQATSGQLQFGIAGFAEGQRTALLGLEQNDSPVYLLDGVDTSLAYNDGTSDRVVDIYRFKRSDGIRIPSSASSIYSLTGHLGYQLGAGQRVELTGLTSQRQNRAFEYQTLYNPRQAVADRVSSQVLTGSWYGRLKDGNGVRLSGEAHLSLQWDRETNGPLSAAGERDSRDPSGIMLSPLGFRFDRSNFAVDEELIDNFRTNTGRRSPYDLDNTSQYQPADEFRNNAYGLLGWTESGGPVGQLTLARERRIVGKGVVTAEFGGQHRLQAGIEATHFEIDFYSALLTSQIGADAYRESPRLTSAFADYDLQLGEGVIHAGARLDHFRGGARRPDFPRISSAPGFNPANPTAGFIDDQSHSRLSPRLSAEFQASPRARLFAGVSALAQLPDFSDLFQGINTDLSTTSSAQAYGTDLDFVHASVMEAGGSFEVDSNFTVSGALWTRRDRDLVITRV